MSGKGSRRRSAAISEEQLAANWSSIDWTKGRKPAPPKQATPGRVLIEDYATNQEWRIPSLEEILGPGHIGDTLNQHEKDLGR